MAGTLLLAAVVAAPPFADLASGVSVVPSGLTVKGKPVDAARWTDKRGQNLVLLAETPRAGTASGGTKKLYGYHFGRANEREPWRQLWRVADAVEDCEFDLTLEICGRIAVTDLDGNGIAETTFAYTGSCRSDVSPDTLKVILHEGDKKYALRGSTRIQDGEDEKGRPTFSGGERTPDPALAGAPQSFLKHAQKTFDDCGGRVEGGAASRAK